MKRFFAFFIYILLLTPLNAYSAESVSNLPEEQEFKESLPEAEIEQYRGASSKFDMDVNFTGNTSNGSVSGSNTISDSAFTDADGFVNIIQNSGNNVVIQSATEVNVTIN